MTTRSFAPLCAAAFLAAVPAGAAEAILDYRDHGFREGKAFYSRAESQKVLAALAAGAPDMAKALGERPVIVGSADGAFSRPGARERAYLVEAAPPAAIEPFPKAAPPVLAIMDGDKAVVLIALKPEVQYQRVAGAADVDADGTSELMLETSFMNMGQISTSLDLVDVRPGGQAAVLQTVSNVYFDGCENPRGERRRSASTLSISGGRLAAQEHAASCPKPAQRK